jgi:spore maturation protein CgeB
MKRKLQIAFFGSSLVSAYWNGAATYYRGIIKTLDQQGHSVTFYEPDVYGRHAHRDIPDPDYAKVIIYQPYEDDLNKCLELAKDADIIIKASGVGIFDKELEERVLGLRKEDQQIIFWDVDAPATLDRMIKEKNDYFRTLVPKFDQILTYGPPYIMLLILRHIILCLLKKPLLVTWRFWAIDYPTGKKG